jgi:DNA-binding NtrC family response regulator
MDKKPENMPVLKLLLVDDEKPFVEAVGRRLSVRGFYVEYAFTGKEALERIQRQHDVDVVVLDMKMPGMDGIETLCKIKKEAPLTEVILLTGHATVQSAVNGMKSGAFDYLMKPCGIDDLVKKINEAAAGKRRHEEQILDIRMKPYATAKEKERRISEIRAAAAKEDHGDGLIPGPDSLIAE